MTPRRNDQQDLLQGKSLQVYWHLVTNGPKGVREIQRELHLPSPSSVSYQINKLVNAGIVSRNKRTGRYYVKDEVKSGLLGFYVRFGYRMIPRFTLYLTVYTVGLLGFFALLLIHGDTLILNPINVIFLGYLVFGTAVFIFESVRIWRMKPVIRPGVLREVKVTIQKEVREVVPLDEE